MKKFLLVAPILICISCLTEDGADLGKGSTFVRYYNGGLDDQAQAFEETPDKGFIILATTQITNSNVTVQRSKIKLIKTDRYGNVEWQTLYPAFDDDDNTSYYKGRGLLVEKNGDDEVTGFTIVGDSIDKDTGVPYLYVMRTNASGEFTSGKSFVKDEHDASLQQVEGQSIVKNSNGDYLLLGSRSDATEDMLLANISKDDLSLSWSREYGEGGSSVFVTGLMTGDNDDIFWGGTVKRNDDPTAIRFIKTVPESELAQFNLDYGLPEFNEETGGICYSSFGSRFYFVGTTDENGSKDILIKKVTKNGIELLFEDGNNRKIIGDEDSPEEGNAVCTTTDGGLLLIGTTGLDEERDYYLIKLNFQGETTWSKVFGSKKADKGVSVKQIKDGSYVILGATTLGGLNSIMLMKTDSKGNIE
jgi:hypothetical protein